MKNFIYQAASAVLLGLAFNYTALAQAAPPIPPAETPEKGQQTEIVIRQKGDKDTRITLEIKKGDYFINGKPLEKFVDQNIIVEKREMNVDDGGPELSYAPSPFRVYSWQNDLLQKEMKDAMDVQRMQMDRQKGEMDMQRGKFEKSIRIRMNEAFLGVSSRKTEKGGAIVLEVTKGSPAEKAGIKKGDIITKVNDTKIENPDGLFETIHNFKPGDKVKITYTREGKEQTAVATLDKNEHGPGEFNYNYHFNMPPMPDMDGMHMGPWGPKTPKLGIKAQDSEDGKGVNILEVEDSSAAAKAGLKKGDMILQFDGADVNSTTELVDRLQDARQKSSVKVKIQRSGVNQEIEIKIPRKLKTAEL